MNRPTNPFALRSRALPGKVLEIKTWVREAYTLDENVVVSITELACRKEGCPDIETVVGIMRPGEKIEAIRVHKALADVTRDDFPPV